ncbi:hypothetical protein S1361_37415 [Streptomyces cyanogenus]|uniref:Uncharacterized protein n=1 Tax=Streptomyces cyanogenus TaxID=80860 RepID=A0ABX7U207_STRCY|nr:hypothetical protein S1361_37415 [Streptomyces cyanogenus]
MPPDSPWTVQQGIAEAGWTPGARLRRRRPGDAALETGTEMATPVIALAAQSVNQVIHGQRVVPSTWTSIGACMRSAYHTWLRQPCGRARNTSCLRAARSPTRKLGPLPRRQIRAIARCSVGIDGGGSPSPLAARAGSSRWTAARFPFHSASRARPSVTVTARDTRPPPPVHGPQPRPARRPPATATPHAPVSRARPPPTSAAQRFPSRRKAGRRRTAAPATRESTQPATHHSPLTGPDPALPESPRSTPTSIGQRIRTHETETASPIRH